MLHPIPAAKLKKTNNREQSLQLLCMYLIMEMENHGFRGTDKKIF